VNPVAVDVYTSEKKTKTPRKTPKKRPTESHKKSEYQNVSKRGPSFYIYLAKGSGLPLGIPSVTALHGYKVCN